MPIPDPDSSVRLLASTRQPPPHPSTGAKRRSTVAVSVSMMISLGVLWICIGSTLLGVKVYRPWSQVTDLWRESGGLSSVGGHFHLYRYLVAYPGLRLEMAWPDVGFSLYTSLFVAANTLLFWEIARLARGRSPGMTTWIIFLAAHAWMNGRGAIGWTGWLMCMLACLSVDASLEARRRVVLPPIPLVLGALLCSSVSSGVFAVVVLAFATLLGPRGVRAFFSRHRRSTIAATLLGLPLAIGAGVATIQHLWAAMDKVVRFYGGGLQGLGGVMTHGFGGLLHGPSAIALVAFATALVGMGWTILLAIRRRDRILMLLVSIPIVGGVAGYTILTLAIPALLVFMLRHASASVRVHVPSTGFERAGPRQTQCQATTTGPWPKL
jgi:hypothetical protein